MRTVEIKVPDIGDFKDVEVIEVMVKEGDEIAKDQSIVLVESDKASMEIPSPESGKVRELKIKLGDKVSEGTLLLTLDVEDLPVSSVEQPKAGSEQNDHPAKAVSPALGRNGTKNIIECDTLVLGAGPGGYTAAFRAADLEDIALTIHPHPSLSETVMFAAEIGLGTITDLYIPRKK